MDGVSQWLLSLGGAYHQYVVMFRDNAIDGAFLVDGLFDDELLQELGVVKRV